MKQTFTKQERLTDKRILNRLFTKGKSILIPPFRLLWIPLESKTKYPVQVVISVPKRLHAKAAQRNLIKRRIKEAYRKNKHLVYEFLEKRNLPIALMIIYTSGEKHSYRKVEEKMILSLQKLMREMQ